MSPKTTIAGVAGTAAAGAFAVRAVRRRRGGREQAELARHISDMLALDTQILSAARRQIAGNELSQFPGAFEIVRTIEQTMDEHCRGLKLELDSVGGNPVSPIKRMVAGVAAYAVKPFTKLRRDTASRAFRDDYIALGAASISYSMLHTAALSLDAPMTAELAQRYQGEVTPLIMRISDSMPALVVAEMARDSMGEADLSIVQEAVQDTREAWREASN